MPRLSGDNRRFLFLQGPHGPFFSRLGAALRKSGATVLRVGFNSGDQAFWRDHSSYIPFSSHSDDWPETFKGLLNAHQITDVVLYGDTRPVHDMAKEIAYVRGLTVHVFEEGYLRPYWITYERGGSNGNSPLMAMTLDQIRASQDTHASDPIPAPAHWGDLRQHLFYGALYHFYVLFRNRRYPGFASHRSISVRAEFFLYLRRFLLLPLHAIERRRATRRVQRGSFPYHLVLLQLAHDENFLKHSPFPSLHAFLEDCVRSFAKGAAPHHHLVFKAHPLEDDRDPPRQILRALCKRYDLCDRVHFVRGGKLGILLDRATSAITVNSTAAQQALWRGLPTKAFGQAIYSKPGLVSDQPLEAFFAAPEPPDVEAYKDFRRYLLQTSQVPGGYYSEKGRRSLLRLLVDMMLSAQDPYQLDAVSDAASAQQLKLISEQNLN